MLIYVRSTLFFISLVMIVIIYALGVFSTFFISRNISYCIIKQWAQLFLWFLKFFCRLDFTVKGLENIPKENGIFFCKHQSAWETIAFITILPKQTWILKRELLQIPMFGWALASFRPIAINRKDRETSIQQILEKGAQRIKEGLWVIYFPEGTRVPAGHMGKLTKSGAKLAIKTQCPIIPIAHNAGEFWPRQGFLKKPGTIQVVIGKPIIADEKDPKEINEEVKAWMIPTMKTIES